MSLPENGQYPSNGDVCGEQSRKNGSVFAEIKDPIVGVNQSQSRMSSQLSRTSDKLVVNLPSQDVDSNGTSLSDETWPGVYLEKNRKDNDSTTSSNSDYLKTSQFDERRSLSSASSRGPTPKTTPLKFDSHFESGNLRAAYQVYYPF